MACVAMIQLFFSRGVLWDVEGRSHTTFSYKKITDNFSFKFFFFFGGGGGCTESVLLQKHNGTF